MDRDGARLCAQHQPQRSASDDESGLCDISLGGAALRLVLRTQPRSGG